MGITATTFKELSDVLQYVNLVKVNFTHDGSWVVAPALFAANESMDILLDGNKPIKKIPEI